MKILMNLVLLLMLRGNLTNNKSKKKYNTVQTRKITKEIK